MSEEEDCNSEYALRLKAGDETVWAGILKDILWPDMQRRIKSEYFLQDADIEEVLSATLINLWRYRERFDPKKSSIRTWCHSIARNCARDQNRRKDRRRQHEAPVSDINQLQSRRLPAGLFDEEDSTSIDDRLLLLKQAIGQLQLSVDDSLIWTVAVGANGGKWAHIIVEELQISSDAARQRFTRIKNKIRNQIKRLQSQSK